MASAREKLQPSKLDHQTQGMKEDVGLDVLKLFIKGKGFVNITADITGGELDRTVEGASTVKININDYDKSVLRSGYLGKHVDVNIDGLYFRLAGFDKTDDDLTLIFEDREIAILRQYRQLVKASRDKVTRAEFILRLIRDVKEMNIRVHIPELHKEQKIAKAPAADSDDIDWSRFQGMEGGAGSLTVKGLPASAEQTKNGQTVLRVGLKKNAPQVLLMASIMAAIQESTMHNLTGGDLDSVGIFQQRSGWGSYASRHNVEESAERFFTKGMQIVHATGPHSGGPLTPGELAQAIQVSAYPGAYDQWKKEAAAWVEAFAGVDEQMGFEGGAWAADEEYEFSTWLPQANGLWKKQNHWNAITRLADEVQWRAFFVSGVFYYISEPELFKSKPRMVISEETPGVMRINGNFDEGKSMSELHVIARLDRWAGPPGSVIRIKDMGPLNGRWLITSVRRSLFDKEADITLKKPLPKLPEPIDDGISQGGGFGDGFLGGLDSATVRGRIVESALRAYKMRSKYVYRQYRPMAESLFNVFARTHTDCSAFVTLCYKSGGAPDPNGFNYNGSGYTGTLWSHGRSVSSGSAQPGDLVFYGARTGPQTIPSHVAVYIGNGEVISFGSTPMGRYDVHYRTDFIGFRTYNVEGRRPAGVGNIPPNLPEYT